VLVKSKYQQFLDNLTAINPWPVEIAEQRGDSENA
jgi:hypothetical protein